MRNTDTKILSLNNLEIGYISGKFRRSLLPPVNASAEKGELIAVIGKNGIGKSTLLGTIAGLKPLLGGDLKIEGTDIRNYTRIKLSGKVGYISTETVKVSNMRVYDLVSIGRYPHTDLFGSIDAKNHRAVLDAIDKAGIPGFSERLLTELSDGERQKAMIAMVLAQDTGVLIMDEPTAFLDIGSKYDVMDLLHDLAQNSNKTIIYSTHDFNMAISHADKIWMIHEGGLAEGAPEDLMLQGIINRLFEGSRVTFDKNNGSIYLGRSLQDGISVSGDGELRFWTEKALLRAGYSVSGSAEITVEAESGMQVGWKCNFRGKSETFSTIYDLVNWLRKMRISS